MDDTGHKQAKMPYGEQLADWIFMTLADESIQCAVANQKAGGIGNLCIEDAHDNDARLDL